jgi:hypothetical protein
MNNHFNTATIEGAIPTGFSRSPLANANIFSATKAKNWAWRPVGKTHKMVARRDTKGHFLKLS